jgi:Spy/CpxP family protein refolding chaperone
MKSSRLLVLGLTLALTTLALSPVTAQQRSRVNFGGGGTGLTIAANENVQKDLGLSSDVSGKLRELREDYSAAVRKEYETAGISFQGFQNMSREERDKMAAKMGEVNRKLDEEFNPKVKALLSADQYKRLQQIQLQSNLRYGGPGALTYSEVAAELKLTDDQKKKLGELNGEYRRQSGDAREQEARAKLREEFTAKTNELLTADQKAALEKLKGPEFDVSQLGFGGRGGRRGKN